MRLMELPDWHLDAPCKGMDDVFFPRYADDTAPAKAICATCRYKVECLDEVMAWRPSDDAGGIRGGLTWEERTRLRRKRRRGACAVPGCDVAVKAQTLCPKHYMQWKRAG